jgi:apoptosis-inducing factor 3
MSDSEKPDLKSGVPIASIPDSGKLQGVVDGEGVLLVRRGAEFFAVGAYCTHYHGPLAEGLVVDNEVRCPWHHACFSLQTGEALRAPALDPIQCWQVEQAGGKVFVKQKVAPRTSKAVSPKANPTSIIIIGGGAAGLAAADMLRRKGYGGSLTMISADSAPPCDRPNLSKDFLAGSASADWIPLRPPEWYSERKIDLILDSRVTSLDTKQKTISTEDGNTYKYGALLLATGADPVKLPLEGNVTSQIFYLRSFADSQAIVGKAAAGKQAVVIGASFIGLEVAASLRARDVNVRVVAPDQVPMEKILGPQVGAFVRSLHESRGVVFHLGETVKRIDGNNVSLAGGQTIQADFIVVGVGVRPSISLAERAGLKIGPWDRGGPISGNQCTGSFRSGRCSTLA